MQKRVEPKNLIELKKNLFLIFFSKELIAHSDMGELIRLKNILDKSSEKREFERIEGHSLTGSFNLKKDHESSLRIREQLIKEDLLRKRKKESIKKIPIKKIKPQKIEKSDGRGIVKDKLSIREEIESGLEIKSPIRIKPKSKEIEDPFISFYDPNVRERVLKIPEPKLPERFHYISPSPTKKEIDLGKLNVLVQDPNVKTIECDGPDERIFVTGIMGKKPTSIMLSAEEIDEVIQKFSEESRIPLQKGVFKVAVGGLILSSVISEVVGSRFVIRKMK